jgi:hypothetical protein
MPRIADNVFIQRDEPLLSVLDEAGTAPAVPAARILHVVNAFDAPGRRRAEQELTFESMRQARDVAARHPGAPSIEQVGVAYAEDEAFAAPWFDRTRGVTRSALDLPGFAQPRKLPLLFDLLGACAPDCAAADVVVFTNSDIVLMPHFYAAVAALLARGFDGLVINRRTVEHFALDAALLPLMQASVGEDHEGFDCFVFPARLLPRFVQTPAIVGMGGVMRSLLYNLVAHCERLLILKRAHLTLHLGVDKDWQTPQYQDYRKFNYGAARSVYYKTEGAAHERLRAFFLQHPEPPFLVPDELKQPG